MVEREEEEREVSMIPAVVVSVTDGVVESGVCVSERRVSEVVVVEETRAAAMEREAHAVVVDAPQEVVEVEEVEEEEET